MMLILSFSGQGRNSLTLKSLEVLEHHADVNTFQKIIIEPNTNIDATWDATRIAMEQADVVIWAVSPFHMNMPSHMIAFFEKCNAEGVHLKNVNTYFTTNMRVCDTFLSNVLERQIRNIADVFVQGLSYATPDMINQKMSLYNLASPDPPPKKRTIFQSKKYHVGEGLRNAVAWYKMLKAFSATMQTTYGLQTTYHAPAYAEQTTAPVQTAQPKQYPLNVLFVDMNESVSGHSAFVRESVLHLKSLYEKHGCNVTNLAQRDFRVRPCDGCKICYASKVCKFKDDYPDYERQIEAADVIIYYGRCIGGQTSSLSKRMVDRDVHNGLMPKNGVFPTKYKSVGFILDIMSDIESCMTFREYQYGFCSFGLRHFLGVYAELPSVKRIDLDIMGLFSLYAAEYGVIPQRNFYSEKVGKHFSDLSQNIPTVIPEEAKYYKKMGGYEPIPVDPHAKTIMPETMNIGIEARKIPYDMAIKAIDDANFSA